MTTHIVDTIVSSSIFAFAGRMGWHATWSQYLCYHRDALLTSTLLVPQAMPLKKDDPMQFYTDMRKLGQGASGTVFVGTDVRTGEASRFA